jgi:hypothetical protein
MSEGARLGALRDAEARLARDDCDQGALALWLPQGVAEALLRERGWQRRYSHRGLGEPLPVGWTSPSGARYADTDDALRVALMAEVLS